MTHKATIGHDSARSYGVIGREFLSSAVKPERLSVAHCHVLDPFIGRIPQAWSSGDDTVGMDKRHTVTINGTTTTMVGSIEGVLGGETC
jgi:hypothetical protein